MASGVTFESPYWVGWAAHSWGVSWGSDAEGVPIQVDELTPAGHWKHLFRPIKGVDAHAVSARIHTRFAVKYPHAVVKLVVAAQTEPVTGKCKLSASYRNPHTGTTTRKVVVKTTTRSVIKTPTAHGVSGFVRGRGRVGGGVFQPHCGCSSGGVGSLVLCYGNVDAPTTVQNPTEEMLTLIFS